MLLRRYGYSQIDYTKREHDSWDLVLQKNNQKLWVECKAYKSQDVSPYVANELLKTLIMRKLKHRELKEIIYYIRKYGIDRVHLETDAILSNKDHATEFYTQVHKGFYYAQDRILLLLPKILNERKRLKSNLKDARRNREKDNILKLHEAIKQNEYQECVVRKVMDALVWIIFQHQPSTVRRLYCCEEPIDITDSNIESEMRFIEDYKIVSPDGFALIIGAVSFIKRVYFNYTKSIL